MSVTNDFDATTQELWAPKVVDGIAMKTPLLAWLLDGGPEGLSDDERPRFAQEGSDRHSWTIRKAGLESVGQVFGTKSRVGMTDSPKDRLDKATFYMADVQVPIRYDEDEKFGNRGKAAIVKVVPDVLEAGRRACRDILRAQFYRLPSTTVSADDEILLADAKLYGLANACSCDATTGRPTTGVAYGTITSTTTTNVWWNPATLVSGWAGSGTAATASFALLNQALDACMAFAEDAAPGNFMFLCSKAVKRAFEMEAESGAYVSLMRESMMQSFGFDAINYKGVEIVGDPYLDRNPLDAATSPGAYDATRAALAFLLYRPSWKFVYDPAQDFRLTPPVWQGSVSGGGNYWLQRVMLRTAGVICNQPAANLCFTSIS